jgi:hypothetical protein
MSGAGQSRRSEPAPTISGLPQQTDIRRVRWHVSKVPVTDIDVASSIAADLPLSRSDTLAGMVSSDAGSAQPPSYAIGAACRRHGRCPLRHEDFAMSRFKDSWRDCTMLPACLKPLLASRDLAMSSASWATEFQLRNLVRLKVANASRRS